MTAAERAEVLRAVRRRTRQPPPPPGPRVRAHRVPLRRPDRLRRLPRSAAPSPADARVAAAHAAPRLHRTRRDRRCRARWTSGARVMDGSADAARGADRTRACDDAAPYAVAMAYRVRFYMDMNAREAMHVIELRTAPQGHPAYRRVCQQMHRLIADAGGPSRDRRRDAVRRSLRGGAGAAAAPSARWNEAPRDA